VPSLIVIPLAISIDMEAIPDCIAAFIDEASDSRAAVGEEVAAGLSSHAIVTGAREADIIGTMEVIEAVAEVVDWARAVDVRAARAMVIVVERILVM
jgi:hypothetical protein